MNDLKKFIGLLTGYCPLRSLTLYTHNCLTIMGIKNDPHLYGLLGNGCANSVWVWGIFCLFIWAFRLASSWALGNVWHLYSLFADLRFGYCPLLGFKFGNSTMDFWPQCWALSETFNLNSSIHFNIDYFLCSIFF